MKKEIPALVQCLQESIQALPFQGWPTRFIQDVACTLLYATTFESNSHDRLSTLINAQGILQKLIAEAVEAEHSHLKSCAARVVYYTAGKTMLGADDLATGLSAAGDAIEATRVPA